MANLSIGSSATDSPIAGAVGLAFFGVSIWGLVCAARITIAAISLLLKGLNEGIAATIVTNILLSAVTGFFAAIATELLRQTARRASYYGVPFLSALFQRQLGESTLGVVFWSRLVLSGLVGSAVGALNGSTGMINLPQFMWGNPEAVIHESAYPIFGLVGGGFGGPGGTGFLSLAFIVLVIIISALLAGLLAGVISHLLLLGLAGATKGAAKAYFTGILRDEPSHEFDPNLISTGAIRGLIIGLTVGILEAIFTVTGIVKFYPK